MSGESNTTPRPCSSHDTVSQMKYLKPLDFYNEIFKGILKKRDYLNSRRLLGLDVSDKYVSFAVSDCKNKTAVPLRILDRQENNLSSMAADIIQSFIHQYKIVGFVVCTRETNPIDAQTQIFIDDLFKTQIFEGLKYTDYASTSKDEEFVFKQHLKFAAENLPQPPPQDMSETIMEKSYVVYALQGYLNFTNKMAKEDGDLTQVDIAQIHLHGC